MQPQQSSRIDLAGLRVQLVKKLGPDKSEQYFHYLDRFLSGKLSKSEFDEFCLPVLGRGILPLHNEFIRSIFKNVHKAKTPPPIYNGLPNSAIQVARSPPCKDDGYEQGVFAVPSQHQNVPCLSNGVLPAPPKRFRSGICGKHKDRPPLGPNGKLESVLHQSTDKTIMGNGNIAPCDYQRPVRNFHAVAGQPDNEMEGLPEQPAKRLKLDGKGWNAVAPTKDKEEAEQLNYLRNSKSPLLAPIGIPFCSASVGGALKTKPVDGTGDFVSYKDSRELSDTLALRRQMEQVAAAQGLGRVSIECANMLNNMLDVYLKRLIKTCVEQVSAGHAKDPRQQQAQNKIINGMRPRNHMHVQSGVGSIHSLQEQRLPSSISTLDFKVAMELNPEQIGEDWPLQLEKICMKSFK